MSTPMPRISLATVDLVGERVLEHDGRVGPDDQLVVVVRMGPVELAGDRPPGRARPDCAKRSPTRPVPPPVGPCALRSTGVNTPGAPGETPTTASVSVDGIANFISIEASVGSSVACSGASCGRLEAADAAPGDGVTVARRVARRRGRRCSDRDRRETAPRGRAGQQPATLRSVLALSPSSKRHVAVGVDEARSAASAEERRRERHVHPHAVVVFERHPVADGGPERGVDPADVVATLGVARETQAQTLQIEGVGRDDEIALVRRTAMSPTSAEWPPRAERRDGAAGARSLLMDPEGVEDAPARGRIEGAALGRGGGAAEAGAGFERFQTWRGAGDLAGRRRRRRRLRRHPATRRAGSPQAAARQSAALT